MRHFFFWINAVFGDITSLCRSSSDGLSEERGKGGTGRWKDETRKRTKVSCGGKEEGRGERTRRKGQQERNSALHSEAEPMFPCVLGVFQS